jgi:hypothetical protein
MNYGVLWRFFRGDRDMYLETADKLLEFFDMRLTKPKKVKGGTR